MVAVVVAGTLTLTTGMAAAETGPQTRLRQELQDLAAATPPGLLALVRDHGRTVFAGSAGTASLQRPRAFRRDDRFRVGSITKSYIAVLVLQLAAEGRFALDDPIDRHLPPLLPTSRGVTIRQLLQMRSGIPDNATALFGDITDPEQADLSVWMRYHSPREMVALVADKPREFEPGTGYAYSNTNYFLLGMLLERVTRTDLGTLLHRRVLAPLGLRHTSFPAASAAIPGPHPHGYFRISPRHPWHDMTYANPSEAWASGAVIATADDVATFYDTLLDGRLLPPHMLAQMRDAVPTGTPGRAYGMGLSRRTVACGVQVTGHSGAMPGFSSYAYRSDTGRTVIILGNSYTLQVDTDFTQGSRFADLAFCDTST